MFQDVRYAPGARSQIMPVTLEELLTVARRLESFPGRWWLAGGWAIDAWLGTATREHEDLEVGILRADQALLRRHLPGWAFRPEALLDSPHFQVWVRPPAPGGNAAGSRIPDLGVFLNDVRDDGQWVSRRHPTVTLPLSELVLTSPLGVPVLAPEVQLLYKAKYHRPKDEHDFGTALPRFSAAQRAWLRRTLAEYHPDDPWLARL